jgi:hypothetical protein
MFINPKASMKPDDPKRVEMLGGRLYLFKYTLTGYASKLIISAHGMECGSDDNATFKLKSGQVLRFYSRHGYTAPARSLAWATGFLVGAETPPPTIDVKGPDCPNYILCKFQGVWTSSGETYSKIQAMQTPGATRYVKAVRSADPEKILTPGKVKHLEFVEAGLEPRSTSEVFDVLTVRNRFWQGRSITLESVMKEVNRLNHSYTEIHCTFCRGNK